MYPVYLPLTGQPHLTVVNKDAEMQFTSPDGGPAAVAAYDRLNRLAYELADPVDLQPGSCLIMNTRTPSTLCSTP